MHELSIAMEILDIVEREAKAHDAQRVTGVRLRIGPLSGVETQSLAFSFDAVKGERALTAGAELTIEEVPVRVRCGPCGGEFEGDGFIVVCPECGGLETELMSGDEMQILDMEID